MTEPSVGQAISNVRELMANMPSYPNVDVSFSHEGAFEVVAHIRTTRASGMGDLVEIHRTLSSNGFEEVNSDMFGSNEWAYEWSEDNY